LEQSTTVPGFWDDNKRAQATLRKPQSLKEWVEGWHKQNQAQCDMRDLWELAREEGDEDSLAALELDFANIEAGLRQLELKKMLSGEDDFLPAIMSIHPGSGGTESQDWALMLFRMYTRYFEEQKYPFKILDYQDGDEAGIKSVTIEVTCDYAYGKLRSEIGVHRLVRISPFDSNARRHTSFSAVYLYPIHEDVELEIEDKDLRVDTFRASGAGGQHINKTDSAVRITHMPTGLVSSCQTERSQIQNRETAMRILKTMLIQRHREEEEAKRNSRLAEKRKIEWGSQIRNYVLHPYSLVKDVRTGVETSNAAGVLDGDLDPFIEAYLLSQEGDI
jgi:peptide chain release factor 2